MSGYTILGLFCSLMVFLALPSVVLCGEVNLKIDFSFTANDSANSVQLVCLQMHKD